MTEETFWTRLDQLISACQLIIDRPAGSVHPRYPDFVYPFDYGYLQGTQAMDQGGLDVWAGSLSQRQVTAVICTVDLTKKDAELKILLGCTLAEAQQILGIHNSGPQSGILIMRDSAR